jgi:polyisoprenoid-binding protein YceI
MKKSTFLFIILGIIGFSFVLTNVGQWSIDGAHSRLGFTVNHMGISNANGAFDKVECIVNTVNETDFTGASFELTADANSINTGVEARDNHLRSADFFDVSKYPSISFKSTSCKKLKGKKYLLVGNLSMHGVTKEITLNATHNGNAKNRAGLDMAGFNISGKFNRSDFGIGKDMPVGVVADEINLNADLEVVKK